MLAQRVRALLRTLGKYRRAALLVLLVVLVDGGPAVATHGATSMEILVWSHVEYVTLRPGVIPKFPRDVEIFDKTMTNLGLVHDVQDQLDENGIPPIRVHFAQDRLDDTARVPISSCAASPTIYLYQFRFATLSVTTQLYYGQSNCPLWTDSIFGVIPVFAFVPRVTLDGMNILDALHEKTGMPVQNS